jgi:hypothetical protein
MRINGSGLVDIGTMFPLSALHVAGRVLASGYDIASDIRLKHDVTPLTGVLARLDNISGVSFRWNAQAAALGHATGQRDIGVIAQEVGAVFPELVTTRSPQDLQAVDYGKLTAVLHHQRSRTPPARRSVRTRASRWSRSWVSVPGS